LEKNPNGSLQKCVLLRRPFEKKKRSIKPHKHRKREKVPCSDLTNFKKKRLGGCFLFREEEEEKTEKKIKHNSI